MKFGYSIMMMGIIIILLFGFLVIVREEFYDGNYKCGVEGNLLCTSKPTQTYLNIFYSGFAIFLGGVIIFFLEDSTSKTSNKIKLHEEGGQQSDI